MHTKTLRGSNQDTPSLERSLNQTSITIARDGFANEGLVGRKPYSGSARQRWARENSKHRRTATRQHGFCCSCSKQSPLDRCKSRVTLENGPFEIIREPAHLRTPAQSTEPWKFRVNRSFCQSW